MKNKFSKNVHVLIVEANFYQKISNALFEGAKDYLDKENMVSYKRIIVPGALEIPSVINFCEKNKKCFHAYIVLGCIIRGETYHFDLICHEVFRELGKLNLQYNIAIGNGILTVENEKQAWERARISERNKGGFAAKTAIEMITVQKKIILDKYDFNNSKS